MNGRLAGKSHVADNLSAIVEGIDETICPYRTICAAEVAQVFHLAVLPKEGVNLWRPVFASTTSPGIRRSCDLTMVIHIHRPAIRSTQRPQLVHLTMLPRARVGLRQSQPTSQKPRIERGSEVLVNDDLGSGWIVATRK